MNCSLHHVHIFAADIEQSIKFYQTIFNGEIMLDGVFAGARNVFIKIGNGRLHLYDQPPKSNGRGGIHHFGIQTDNLAALVDKLISMGIPLKNQISDFGYWKYIMISAPDDILIELFEINKEQLPAELENYFTL